jgi:hypothetical protein
MTKLKEVIQAANPEIMELKFGCEFIENISVRPFLKKRKIVSLIDIDTGSLYATTVKGKTLTSYHKNYLDNDCQILGRPIRLADVLFALNKRFEEYTNINRSANMPMVRSNGSIYPGMDKENTDWYSKIAQNDGNVWNLKDDNLDNQSPECIKFLTDLLT